MNLFRLMMKCFFKKRVQQDKRFRTKSCHSSIVGEPIMDTPDIRHVINRIALQKLLNEIRRPDFLENLIVIYLRDSKLCNQRLEQASQAGDYVLWRKVLHEFKGMANNLCLERLTDAIAKAHSLPKEYFPTGAQIELTQIQYAMHEAECVLKDFLDKPVARSDGN